MTNQQRSPSIRRLFITFLPLWIFLVMYKLGGSLHYSIISPLGEQLMPLWVVGAVISASSFVQMILDVPAGYILDRFGYLRFLKISVVAFLVAGIAFMYDLTIVTYAISMVAATISWLLVPLATNAYVLAHAPEERSSRFFAMRDMAISTGVFLASAILGFVLLLDVQVMGLIITVCMAIALVVIFFAPPDKKSFLAEVKLATCDYYVRRNPLGKTLCFLPKLNPASIMLLLLGFSSSVFYAVVWFIVPLVIAHQASSGLLSLGLGIFDLAIVITGFFLGKIAEKGDKRTYIFFGLLLFSISATLIGFDFGWLFLLFGFLATTGDELTSISLWSWLHTLSHDDAGKGLLASVITLAQDLGWAVGPIFAAVAYGWVGPSWAIASSAVFIFATWIAYQFLMRYYPKVSPVHVPSRPSRARHRG
ncbi:MAG: MFS transporter [Parcubacteria group bacterium]|nr:MFS transporter [Parcubacteria group bacterium]